MVKNRADSVQEAVKLHSEAQKVVMPPKFIKLRKGDIPFWTAIVSARYEWTDVDLIHAANLARCQADIEKLQRQIDREGNVIKNAKGTKIANPKHALLETLSRRAVAMSRMIQVHAAATMGESKLSRGKNEAKRHALNSLPTTENDLIKRPQ